MTLNTKISAFKKTKENGILKLQTT